MVKHHQTHRKIQLKKQNLSKRNEQKRNIA